MHFKESMFYGLEDLIALTSTIARYPDLTSLPPLYEGSMMQTFKLPAPSNDAMTRSSFTCASDVLLRFLLYSALCGKV